MSTDKGTLQLSATVLPETATNKTVTWSITNGSGEASISQDGLVTAIDNGTVTAIATATDGSGVAGYFEITISNQLTPVSSITITGAAGSNTISTDKGTLQLSATVLPETATNKTVTWSLTNGSGEASISQDGLVTAINNGTVTVTATATDGSGVAGYFEITISNQLTLVSSITITGAGGSNTISTDKGTLQLSATVLPETATK
ncbi:MAG: Ig-like domain-containing protein [Bacteroidales bacterium]